MSHALQPSEAALPPPYFESEDRRFRLYQGDCLELMPRMPEAAFDLIFADPPYFLSNGGITCHAGKMVSVHKGKWDESKGAEADHEFTLRWLAECRRLLKPSGSIWVSGTAHIIHSVGYAMQRLGFKLLNDITWRGRRSAPETLASVIYAQDHDWNINVRYAAGLQVPKELLEVRNPRRHLLGEKIAVPRMVFSWQREQCEVT